MFIEVKLPSDLHRTCRGLEALGATAVEKNQKRKPVYDKARLVIIT